MLVDEESYSSVGKTTMQIKEELRNMYPSKNFDTTSLTFTYITSPNNTKVDMPILRNHTVS